MNLLRRKSVTELQTEALTDHSLKRALGALNLTMLGIGAIIGTGIFVLTGTVAALNSGPAVVLSFTLAGVASIFAALCYSEFASLVPMAGSAYTYGYATLGELIAWIIGWDLVLEYALGAVTVAIGWSGYVVSFLHDVGIDVPCALAGARGTMVACHDGTQVAAVFNLPAVIIIGLVTTLLVIGIKESANFNNVIVFVKVAVVLLFIVGAAHAINPVNWHPFIPPPGLRVERRHDGGGDRVLRLHRVRRGQHGGAGGAEPAEGHAHRHHRLPAHLHGAVHPGLRDRDGRDVLQGAERPRSHRRRGGPRRTGLDVHADQARCHRGAVVGDPGDAPGAVACLLLDGARRPAAAVRQQGAPQVPDALPHLHRDGGHRRVLCGDPADPRRREPGFDRDAAGIRDRVGGDPGAAPARAEPAAGVQDSLGLVRGPGRSLLGRVPHEVATVADVGAADYLVRDRDGALLRVQRVALEARVEGAVAVVHATAELVRLLDVARTRIGRAALLDRKSTRAAAQRVEAGVGDHAPRVVPVGSPLARRRVAGAPIPRRSRQLRPPLLYPSGREPRSRAAPARGRGGRAGSGARRGGTAVRIRDRKSTRLNSSH